MDKVLIVVGDATETVDTLYPYYRLQEDGFVPVVTAPEKRRYQMVMHEVKPGWTITKEWEGYSIDAGILLGRRGHAVAVRDLRHFGGDMDLHEVAVGREDHHAARLGPERKRLGAVGRGDLGDDEVPGAEQALLQALLLRAGVAAQRSERQCGHDDGDESCRQSHAGLPNICLVCAIMRGGIADGKGAQQNGRAHGPPATVRIVAAIYFIVMARPLRSAFAIRPT